LRTPIDENSTLVYFLRYRKLAVWRSAYWRFLYKTFWEKQHLKVIEQDRIISNHSEARNRDLRNISPTRIAA
jgi:hypothetical protein